ncbi:MAG: SDR family oxidoreductase [Candidatus Binataceae bacterium]|jgi:NAD(P)-dependent dehydrogenase (short-subunit alcohol dehydrogenase family)
MDAKKIAVVSGANRGIGFEACKQLARIGFKVVMTARDSAKGKAACEQLKKQGLDVIFHQLDPDDARSIEALARYLEKNFGKLDVLVNNAGILLPEDKPGTDVDLDTVRKTLETNVVGVLALSQAMIPLMRKHGGHIINVSSDMASLADMVGGYLAYRVSKTALNAMTRVLASDLAGTKIRVNSMSPGWVRTDMGGDSAPLSVEQGADTITWLATTPDDGPTGGFFRERKPMAW